MTASMTETTQATSIATPEQEQQARALLRFFGPEEKHDPTRLEPREAAVKLRPYFRSIARQLAPDDASTQDDLVQEMSLVALLTTEAQTRTAYCVAGLWRAIDYLRWWYFPMFKPGDKKKPEPWALPPWEDEDATKDGRKLTSPEIEKACESLRQLVYGRCQPAKDEHIQQAT